MDDTHKHALSRLLNEILGEKQTLVATQDTELKQYMEKSVAKANVVVYELTGWNTEWSEIS